MMQNRWVSWVLFCLGLSVLIIKCNFKMKWFPQQIVHNSLQPKNEKQISSVTIILVYHPFSRAPLLVINLCIHMQSVLPGWFKQMLQLTQWVLFNRNSRWNCTSLSYPLGTHTLERDDRTLVFVFFFGGGGRELKSQIKEMQIYIITSWGAI